MATNTTQDNDWSESSSILTGDTAAPGTLALSASVGTQSKGGLNGIRVYYGSSKGRIQMVGMDFPESMSGTKWWMWAEMDGSDEQSGVASVTLNNVEHTYLRNSTTGKIQLWTWDYYDEYINDNGALRSSAYSNRKPIHAIH